MDKQRREVEQQLASRRDALKPLERAASGVTLSGRRLGEGHFGRVEEAHIRADDGEGTVKREPGFVNAFTSLINTSRDEEAIKRSRRGARKS
jgi:hypothetical protein